MKYRARRRPTSFDVTVRWEDESLQASIIDVNDKGARIELHDANLEEESPVWLMLHGKERPAKVVWYKDGVAGIAFDQFLPLDVLSAVNRSFHRPSVGKKKRFLME